MNQVGASAGDYVAAAHVHSDAHHAMRGHPTPRRGDNRGHTSLWVKVRPSTALPIQLSLRVVGVGGSAGERLL